MLDTEGGPTLETEGGPTLETVARMALGRIRAQGGQTMAEYVMLVGFIAIVVLAAGLLLGSSISALFTPVINAFL